MKFRILFYLACGLLLLLAGCVRPSPHATQGPVELVQSAPMDLNAPDTTENTVYVAVREHTGKLPQLEARLETSLKAKGYDITPNPSMAGYIIQLNVVYAGIMDPQIARQAVPGGYGHTVEAQGEGAAVLMTDVIIAARSMPKTTRRQSHVVASTSVRTKVADEQTRLAALMPGKGLIFAQARPALEESIIGAVGAAFSPVTD